MSDDPEVNSPAIAIIAKNRLADVRIHFSEFKGYDLLDLRTFQVPRTGGRRVPTRAGISLRIELLPQLIEGLQRAERKAQDAGLLPP